MKLLVAFCVLAFTAHVASKCPSGTMQGLNDQDCYHFNAAPAMWLKAEDDCIKRKGHLASVSSTMTNAMLRQISSLACANEFWLGGSWDTESPRQGSWTDGRRFSYKNWASGQPVNQEYYCIALDASGGRWYSRACRTAKPYICKVPPVGGVAATTATPFSCPVCPTNSCTSRSRAYSTSTVQSSTTSTSSTPPINGRCRDGWTYVAATGGKCLRITDSSDTWSNTWAKCKRLGGNLVSIPDDTTNNALRDYAYIREGLDAKTSSWFAIGIYKPTTGGPWQWTDGTPVTYTNWQEGEYDTSMINITILGVYGQIADNSDLYNGRWEGINEAAAAPSQDSLEAKSANEHHLRESRAQLLYPRRDLTLRGSMIAEAS